MKYIISEDQNEKMINLIVKIGEKFVSGPVVKTELFAKYNSEWGYYVVYPTFYVNSEKVYYFSSSSTKYDLVDYIESYLGVRTSVGSTKVKWV